MWGCEMNIGQLDAIVNIPVSKPSQVGKGDSVEQLNDVLSHHLSPRQAEILLLMLRGFSRSEIARQLDLSARTVDTVRARMMIKLNAKSNSELALKAFSLRIHP